MKISALFSLCAAISLYDSSPALAASDWPQWRGPNRDGRAAGFEAPQSWPAELKPLWKLSVGEGVASPALVGGRLYVFTRQDGNEVTRCLNPADGKEIWVDKFEAQGASGPSSGFSGPRSSPAVADGKVVTYGVRGTLSCLDAGSGKVIWRKQDLAPKLPRFFTSASPLIAGGSCFIQLGGEEGGSISSFELASGEQKWTWSGDGSAYASPALVKLPDRSEIVALTAGKIVALDASNGQLLWELPFAAQGRAYNAATPLFENGVLFVTGSGRGTKALNLPPSGVPKELWSNPEQAVQFNTPILNGSSLYGITQNGDLFCLNRADGATQWTFKLGGRGFGSVVDVGSYLVALTPQGDLVIFQPDAKEFKKVTSYKVGTDTYAYPIPADGGFFIKDKDSLAFLSCR